eukprot:789539-Pyramimonas_sp.AAC.1
MPDIPTPTHTNTHTHTHTHTYPYLQPRARVAARTADVTPVSCQHCKRAPPSAARTAHVPPHRLPALIM